MSEQTWTAVTPVPDDVPSPPLKGEAYPYRLPDGKLYGYVCRWDEGGRKQVRPLVWAQNGSPDSREWRWMGLPTPRPLYGAELLAEGVPVLVVEGERKCNLTREQWAGKPLAVVSWCGGSKAVAKTDWSPLAGHQVTIWPDNDDPGREAAAQIAEAICRSAASVSIVATDPAWPKGYDLADLITTDGWNRPMVAAWIKSHSSLYEPALTPEERLERKADREDARMRAPVQTPPETPVQAPTEAPPPAEPVGEPDKEWLDGYDGARGPTDTEQFPFTLLGHDHGNYYYLGHGTRQITILTAPQHSNKYLYKLAPESFWGRRWPKQKGRGFDDEQAASDLITAQHMRGVYNPARIRGRGAWWDKDRAIIHLGDRLLIGEQELPLHEHDSKHIYEYAVPLDIDTNSRLRNAEAAKLESVCKLISWDDSVNGRLLAGWIVCATVCGALRWKPNIWLIGPKESGKSTVIDHIVKPALGENVLHALGGTTEPALRNLLKSDALPIIIDDMDSSTDRGRMMNQQILGLMRVFSGEGSGAVHKGSQSGVATTYKIHSSYIFSSIRQEAEHAADKSRICVLKLKPGKFTKGQYADLRAQIDAVLTPEFAPALFARTVRLIPVIRKNAETFAQAVGGKTGSQRSGDLLGHLFAGAFALTNEGLISPDAADSFVGSRAEVMALIQEQKQELKEAHEGDQCLWHLMEQIILDTNAEGKVTRRSVSELIHDATGAEWGAAHVGAEILRRHGIVVQDGMMCISNDHTQLRALYKNSLWPIGWGAVLKTVAGATASPNPIRFGGRQSRATCIPLSALRDEKPKPIVTDPDSPDF